MRITPFILVVLINFCGMASYTRAEETRIPVATGAALVLPVPDKWRTTRRPGPVPTVSITPASGGDSFQVLVSPLVAPDGSVAPASLESLRRLVGSAATRAKSQSVEESLPIQNFGSGDVQGYYFSATDRAPKPGEFKFMTQGAMSVSGLPVSFTILSNGNAQQAVEPALHMLLAARKE